MTTEARTNITEAEHAQVKEKLGALLDEYQSQIDLMAKEAQVLAVIRSQINLCLELIATYEENLNDGES